jgi:hypothetical protein
LIFPNEDTARWLASTYNPAIMIPSRFLDSRLRGNDEKSKKKAGGHKWKNDAGYIFYDVPMSPLSKA